MELGDRVGAGQRALRRLNTKELSGYLEFFTVRSKGFQDGADRQYSLPGTCRCFLYVFKSYGVVFSALCWSGYPSS